MPRRSTSSSTGRSTGNSTAPRNRTPQPVTIRRRSFGDFVKAFFAFVALLGLVVGVPGALAVSIGWPLPSGVPSLDWLQQEITVTTFLHILTVVVWLAWAQFTACVLVEVKAALSGVGVPGRVPGAGPSQLLARQLVAALLLVGATAASLTPGWRTSGTVWTATRSRPSPPPRRPRALRPAAGAGRQYCRRPRPAGFPRAGRSAAATPSSTATRSTTGSSRPRGVTTTPSGRSRSGTSVTGAGTRRSTSSTRTGPSRTVPSCPRPV